MNHRCSIIFFLALGPSCLLGFAEGPPLRGSAATEYLKQNGTYDSLGEAVDAAMYGAHPDGLGFSASNPVQNFAAHFSSEGLAITGKDWGTRWSLRSVGYGDRQVMAAPAQLTAQGARMELSHGVGVTEWYVNTASGLEHGFTVQRPEIPRAGDRLRLVLDVAGDLRPSGSGDGIDLVRADGIVALRYQHLVVTDATGRTLPARMAASAHSVWVEVDDAGAAWPITIDPTFVQQAYLESPNQGLNDRFGNSVAVSGKTVLVGAPGVPAAYIFVRDGSSWVLQAQLRPRDNYGDTQFGYAVALDGDTAAVGAPNEPIHDFDFDVKTGGVYVFLRNGVTWTQQAEIISDFESNIFLVKDGHFGNSVALSGNTLVVGATYEDSAATGVNGDPVNGRSPDSGAAWVFVRNGTAWAKQAYLKASNTGSDDHFGYSVAVSGETVVIGAPREDSSSTGVNGPDNNGAEESGAAYVFTRSNGTWSQQAFLKASRAGTFTYFGHSVGISGDTIAVGAPGDAFGGGDVYAFVRDGSNWMEQFHVRKSQDAFGVSVSVSGNVIVVGSPYDQSPEWDAGGAYVYERSGNTWSQYAYLQASDSARGQYFGIAVGVSDGVIVGSRHGGPGAAYVFSTGCGSSLFSPSQSVSAAGGVGSVGITASPGCDWTAASSDAWLTVTSGSPGNGDGTVGFLAATNPAVSQRSGTLTIAGKTFMVIQAGTAPTCTYTLGLTIPSILPVGGGTGLVNVNAGPSCPWAAISSVSWILINGGAAGLGSGTVQYTVLANSGPQRAGALTIAGQIFAATQVGSAVSDPTPDNALILSQLVGGGTEWHTTLFVTNLSNTTESFTIRFYNDFGLAAVMPIDTLGLVDSITGTLTPGQTRLYETGATGALYVAWAMLTPATPGTARLSGFAVFRQTVPRGSSTTSIEAVVDFTSPTGSKYVLLYDNLAGFATTAALANPDVLNPLTILADIRDEQGVLLGSDSITLPPLGHTAFVLAERFPLTIGRRGSVRFAASPKGFTGLGLRFSPFQTFTSFRLMTSADIQ